MHEMILAGFLLNRFAQMIVSVALPPPFFDLMVAGAYFAVVHTTHRLLILLHADIHTYLMTCKCNILIEPNMTFNVRQHLTNHTLTQTSHTTELTLNGTMKYSFYPY